MKMQFTSGPGERSGSILDSLPDPVFFFDETGELRYANKAGEALIGKGDGSPRRFCDIVDCGASTFAQVIDNVRQGTVSGRLRGRPGLDKEGAPLLFQVNMSTGELFARLYARAQCRRIPGLPLNACGREKSGARPKTCG